MRIRRFFRGAGLLALWALCIGGPETALAEDPPFFAKTGSGPDVLFVLDGSAFMQVAVQNDPSGYNRAQRTVQTIREIVQNFSPLGVRFGLIRTANNTKVLSACKVGTVLTPIAANNTSAMNTALTQYLTDVSGALGVGAGGQKDFERAFDTAKTQYGTAISADLCKSDRNRVVIFVTSGGSSIRQNCMDDAKTYIGQLYTLPSSYGSAVKIPTFVMGYNLTDGTVGSGLGYEKLEAMAVSGHTVEPRDAKDYYEFVQVMNGILVSLMHGDYSGGTPAISIDDEDLYQSAFRIYDQSVYPNYYAWEGHLSDFILDADGDVASMRWDSGVTMTNLAWTNRKVYSGFNDGTDPLAPLALASANASAFASAFALSAQGGSYDVNKNGVANESGDVGALIDFMVGDETEDYDGGDAREPYRILDFINSSPTYVPPPFYPRLDADYMTAYQPSQKTRSDFVVLSSNAGTIHAFDAATNTVTGDRVPSVTGRELFAYAPVHVLPRMKELWRYTTHPILQDATGRYADVRMCQEVDPTCPTDANRRWATVYVQGDGIEGDEASCKLAITDPTNYKHLEWHCGWYTALDLSLRTGATVPFDPLWEFKGDGDIIAALAEPTFGRVRLTVASQTEFKDVAFVAGKGVIGTYGTATTVCATPIYVIDIRKGTALPNSKIYLPYESGACTADGLRGARATILPVDTNNDLIHDRLYVGDMNGQFWRIDLSSASPSAWNGTRTLLFSAPNAYPIGYGATATYHPSGDILVYFGLGTPDTLASFGASPPKGYFYAMLDNRIIASGSHRLFNGSGEFAAPSLANGEVLAGEPVIVNGVIYFTTYTVSSNACRLGTGRLYGVNYYTGANGLDSDNDGALDAKYIDLGEGIPSAVTVGQNRWYVTVNDGGGSATPGPTSSVGNLSASGTATGLRPLQNYSWMEVTGR